MGQGDFDDFGAEGLQLPDGRTHRRVYLWVHAADHVFLGQADAKPLQRSGKCGPVIWNRFLHGGRIHGVVAAEHLSHQGGIGHVFGERTNLVERTGKGRQAVAGNPTVGGLDAHDTAERGWLSDGSPRIGTDAGEAFMRGDTGSAATGRSSRNAGGVPRVERGEEG